MAIFTSFYSVLVHAFLTVIYTLMLLAWEQRRHASGYYSDAQIT